MTAFKRRQPSEGKHAAYRKRMAELVRVRWERGNYRCEGCNLPVERVECAHLFGRRNIIKEPYASDPALMAALCGPCHRSIDQNIDVELRDRLRSMGIARYCHDHFLILPAHYLDDPIAAVRELERVLEARETQ